MSDPAVFLDRDGVLDALVYYPSHDEWESPRTVGDLTVLPGSGDALRQLGAAGWRVFVVSNQPSAAKGKTSMEELARIHERLLRELGPVPVEEFFYCYHHPHFGSPCDCRKPSPWRVLDTALRLDLDLRSSWFVGDQDTDIETGIRAGCRTALIEYPHSRPKRGKQRADLVCSDLPAFVRVLASQETA